MYRDLVRLRGKEEADEIRERMDKIDAIMEETNLGPFEAAILLAIREGFPPTDVMVGDRPYFSESEDG